MLKLFENIERGIEHHNGFVPWNATKNHMIFHEPLVTKFLKFIIGMKGNPVAIDMPSINGQFHFGYAF